MVHRDLKPDNVMVGEFGETVVLDWGIAKVLGAAEEQAVPRPLAGLAPQQTMQGSVMGTPLYLSPEQAAGDIAAIDRRSDVWSLGVMLYELVAGRLPFEAESLQTLLTKVRGGRYLSLPEALPGVSPEVIAFANYRRAETNLVVAEQRLATERQARTEPHRHAGGAHRELSSADAPPNGAGVAIKKPMATPGDATGRPAPSATTGGASKRANRFPRFTTILDEPIRSKSGQEVAVVCTRDREPTKGREGGLRLCGVRRASKVRLRAPTPSENPRSTINRAAQLRMIMCSA